MRQGRFRLLAGWLLLVMLLALAPVAAGAGGEWNKVGGQVWLKPGEGINLATGGAGDDILFRRDTLESRYGMQVAQGGKSLDYDLTPPTDGYVTSLDTTRIAYSRILVRLADGSVAQVRLGMASFSGMIYTGLFLEEWAVLKGALPQGPAQQGTPPQGAATPTTTPQTPVRGTAKLKLNSLAVDANGTAATLDVGPQQIGGQVMLPLRFVADAMGLSPVWDARERKVSITGAGLSMTLWVDRSTALINGQTVTLSQPPTMVGNRLLVPLNVVGEALAGKASYDPASGAITLGGNSTGNGTAPPVANPPVTNPPAAEWPAHFGGIWLWGYKDGLVSEDPDAKPDFYLTLNSDGSARVIQTITDLVGAVYHTVNLEYKGTYTLDPLRVELALQPALKGWETHSHRIPYWQSMTVTGTLSADMSRIDNLSINGGPAKSGAAGRVRRVPDPGKWQ